MGVANWLTRIPSRMQRLGIEEGTRKSSREVARHFYQQIDKVDQRGRSIYDEEWDALIVLDACRVDLLKSVANDYEFISKNDIGKFRSKASCSRLWMERNFTSSYQEEMRKTAHVTANPYSDSYLETDDFLLLDEVWKYGWDDEVGTVPARRVTDRAIATAREENPDRLIVHYLQPHFPSIPRPLGSKIDIESFGRGWESVWDRLETGELEKEQVWNSFKANLKYVLDDVEVLLENIDAENAIITADHTNALGERGQYGHPPRVAMGILRNVPWVVTSAKNKDTYTPETDPDTTREVSSEDVESRLEYLGYL